MLKIDMHTHLMPKNFPRFAEKFGYGGFIHLDHHAPGRARMMQEDKFFREIKENCWDPEVRFADYDPWGVQVQVICTIPVLFSYWAKPQDTLEVSRFLNDDIAEIVAKHPKRYAALATLPMNDPELAAREMERSFNELGLRGAQIGSNINGENLSEPKFDVVWETCERIGAAIMVHPWEMMGKEQMEKYWLPWLVGMPAETSRAACSMIFGGVFERFPKLRVCFSHAGGAFLPTLGRIEHGYNCRPDLVAVDNPVNPREYLGRFWIDSITHDPKLLQYVVDLVGPERVCLGSDYPFPLGDLEFGKLIDEMPWDEDAKAAVFHRSTLEWLGMSKEDFK